MSGWNMQYEEVTPGGPNPLASGVSVAQQQNPYDSLKKLFGGNLQRSGGNLQDLFSRIGQQTGQMQGAPNSQYEGRNSDGSIFRSQFPMGNNPPRPRVMTQGPESMLRVQTGINKLGMRGNNPPRMPSRPDIRQRSEFYQPQGPQQPLRQEAGHDALNRQIQQRMGQSQERMQPGLSKEFLSGIFGAQRPMPSQDVNTMARMPQRMRPQPRGPFGGGGRQRFPQPQQPRGPLYGQQYNGGMYGQQPQRPPMYPQPPMYPRPQPQYGGGMYGGGGMYDQPQRPPMYGGGFGGGMGGGMYGGGMGGGMYGQPQMQQPQYGGGGFGGGMGGGMYGGGFNQQQPQQQPYNPYAQSIMGGMPKFNMQAMY